MSRNTETKQLTDSRWSRAQFALSRIRSTLPKKREALIPFGIFERAVQDVVLARESCAKKEELHDVLSALIYLSSPDIHELSLCDIETSWAMEQLDKARVWA